MGHIKKKPDADVSSLEEKLDMIFKKLLVSPVSSPEWDKLIKEYNATSYEISKHTGSLICSIDLINY